MRLLMILWVATMIGLVGVYNRVCELKEVVKQETWYQKQVERWVIPYEYTNSFQSVKHKQTNKTLMEKRAKG